MVVTAAFAAVAAHAQDATSDFPDVPQNHWAYEAVHDLASKGLVKGYPDGTFLGSRAMTRFEFATVIDRMLQTIADMKAGETPTTGVTEDDLNKVQVLVDKFQPQLDAIQANVTKAQSDIDTLRQELDDLRQDVEDAKDLAAKAQDTANHSYGTTLNRKFSITGLVESRIITPSATNNRTQFPQGTSATGAGGTGPYNGTYDMGSSGLTAEVRRARIIMNGAVTTNTSYKIQLDVSGAVNTKSTPNSQISVLEAYGQYAFGDGSSKNPMIAAGEFANPYGWILPASPVAWLSPERPLAFSEQNNVGMWDSQDYDKGVRLIYGPNNFRFVYAAVNGAGRQSEDVDNHLDSIFHLGYTTNDKQVQVGASYYDGYIDRDESNSGTALTSFPTPKKELGGVDAEFALKNGITVQGEYVKGTYEKRAYYDESVSPAENSSGIPGTDVLNVDPYVKGNQAQGYYIWGGYTWHQTGNHPLTLGMDYDVFDRSISSQSSPENSFSSVAGASTASSGSSFDDVNWGGGILYNLDKATRLRLWYETPTAVSHLPGTPEPPHNGLYTAEWLARF